MIKSGLAGLSLADRVCLVSSVLVVYFTTMLSPLLPPILASVGGVAWAVLRAPRDEVPETTDKT